MKNIEKGKLRDIKISTYWKMQNAFFFRTNVRNPFSLLMKKLRKIEDYKLNEMSIDDWNEFSIIKNKYEEYYNHSRSGKIDLSQTNFLLYESSMAIEYPYLQSNMVKLIPSLLILLEVITKDKGIEIMNFIGKIYKLIDDTNYSKKSHDEVVNINKNLIEYSVDDEWIVDILSQLDIYGYRILIKNKNGIILPFWDWTSDFLFLSLNNKLRDNNFECHGNLIESIMKINIEAWNCDDYVLNMEYKIKGGMNGEVDFAFIKNDVLYIFENKNITSFSNPNENNYVPFMKWRATNIDKGMKQLHRLKEFSKEIFSDWKFSKVVTILCTTSRNRFEPRIFKSENPPDIFIDLDSLMFCLNINQGYRILLYYSYFQKINLSSGIYDLLDFSGIFFDIVNNKITSEHRDNINSSYLKLYIESIIENTSNVPNDKSAYISDLILEWTGDYRKYQYYMTEYFEDNKVAIEYEKNILSLMKGKSKSVKIRVLKFIFGEDATYNKNLNKVEFKY